MLLELDNIIFEETTAIQFDGPWMGVTSVSFNSPFGLSGELDWIEGYQFRIDINDNKVTLGARRNYGQPVSCEQFFDSIVNDCSDIISYINSVGVAGNPGNFTFIAGPHVKLYEDVENHRIYVGLNFDTPDVCKTVLPNPIPNII